MTPADVIAKWRVRREEWGRVDAHVDGAVLCDEVLRDLFEVQNAQADELLTLHEAATISDYSEDSLGRLVREGAVPNTGAGRRSKSVALVPDSLVNRWRTEAATLRRRGAPQHAEALETCAEELEAALREHELETLTLKEAAAESRYSTDHLGRLIREGKLPNAGRENAPRIRRCDLPSKTKPFDESGLVPNTIGASRKQIARSIVAQGGAR